jgi:hypothetical protein
VTTKLGTISTDHILFICSGAFHSAKPSDMLAELQGRLPIRVELAALTQEDFYRILTEPQHNMIEQQQVRRGLLWGQPWWEGPGIGVQQRVDLLGWLVVYAGFTVMTVTSLMCP